VLHHLFATELATRMTVNEKLELEKMFKEVQLQMGVGYMTVLKSANAGDGAEAVTDIRLAISRCATEFN
jgi:hypothetical protein